MVVARRVSSAASAVENERVEAFRVLARERREAVSSVWVVVGSEEIDSPLAAAIGA